MRSAIRASALLGAILALSSLGPAVDSHQAEPEVREQAWAIIHEGVYSEKSSHRLVAVQALSLMPKDRRAIQYSLHLLKDPNQQVRAAAATTLGQMHATAAIPALKKAVDDSQVSVSLAAAHSLYLLKDKSAYAIYYSILMGDKKTSEGLVQSQLDRFRDPKQVAQLGFQEGIGFVPYGGMGYEAIRQLRKHDGSPARAAAARLLASDPDKISEDALMQTALADKENDVRLAALDALAERGDPQCIERLAKNLSEDKTVVRYRTAAVILHLSDLTKRPTKSAKGQNTASLKEDSEPLD